MEVLLIVVILFLLSRKSYKHPKKPLTEKVRSYESFGSLFWFLASSVTVATWVGMNPC